MYESRLLATADAVPAYDNHITDWLARHPGSEFGGLPVRIALQNDEDEIYRLIHAEGLLDLISLAAMLMKLGLCSDGPSTGYDDIFRMP